MPDINGIPYVESTDLVSGWPTVSQSVAQEVSDQLASKPTFTYGTATPTADADGAIWYDENDTPPTPKFWDGSAWQPFSSGIGAAAISSPAATGQYTDSGITYDYYVFTSSGTLTVDDNGSGFGGFADVLVVGGGGGGGDSSATFGAGGGGGGGYLAITNAYLPASTLTVVVGAGGSASDGDGRMGITSRLGDYFAVGGGGGTRGADVSGFHGGSGGGGCGTGVGGASTSGQGNTGGNGATNGGGGGGGAGAVGTNATSGNGGAGGSGLASSITGSSVTRAGGGGGGGNNSGGAGGTGGGTAGVVSGTATSAAANTGGGAGGGGGSGAQGGAGGSGVVIVRVKV